MHARLINLQIHEYTIHENLIHVKTLIQVRYKVSRGLSVENTTNLISMYRYFHDCCAKFEKLITYSTNYKIQLYCNVLIQTV